MAEQQRTVTFDLDWQGEEYLAAVDGGGSIGFYRESDGSGIRLREHNAHPLITADQAEQYAINLLAAVAAARAEAT
jgi:hypothetical protein